jgi:WD40 repeat protein
MRNQWLSLILCFSMSLLFLTGVSLAVQTDTLPDMGEVYALYWSKDGTRLLSVSADGVYRIWNMAGEIELEFPGHTGDTFRADWSPDNTRVITASYKNSARVWDAQTGRLLLTLIGHSGQIMNMRYSPDGTRIVTTSEDGLAKVWDAQTGEELLSLEGHYAIVRGADWSPDGTRIATTSGDGTALVWHSQTGEILHILVGHRQTERLEFIQETVTVLSARWSPDGTRIMTGGDDGQAIIWDAASGEILHYLEPEAGDFVVILRWSADSQRVIVGVLDGSMEVWDAASGTRLFTLVGQQDFNTNAEFSPDGTRILTGNFDGTAAIWDAQSGEHLQTIAHHASVNDATWNPSGTFFATAGQDGTIRFWTLNTGEETAFAFPPASESASQPSPVGQSMVATEQAVMTQIAEIVIQGVVFGNAGPAYIGENVGSLRVGTGQMWTYDGKAGEMLTFELLPVRGDYIIRILDEDDDLIGGNGVSLVGAALASVENVVLPADGRYRILISVAFGAIDGDYTLRIAQLP